MIIDTDKPLTFTHTSTSQPVTEHALVNDKNAGRVFRKEALPVGTWYKDDQEINVEEGFLKHVVSSVDTQLARGIRIDMPSEHTSDPDASRGKIIGAEVGKNSKGEDALFTYCEFAPDHVGLAQTAEVSVHIPPAWTDGKKNEYTWPLRHVALTQKPIVHGMSDFELVLSMGPPSTGTVSMSLATTLREKLGLKADATDDEIEAAFLKSHGAPAPQPPAAPQPPSPEPDPATLSFKPPIGTVKQFQRSRIAELDSLVPDHATPATVKTLKEQWCSDAAITASLTLSEGDSDPYESVLGTLRMQKVQQLGDGTSSADAQITLSGADVSDPKKNPLVAAAAATTR